MASPATAHAISPERLAAKERVEEIREMAINRGNMMNDGAYRTSSQAGPLLREITGWVEELCTLADIDRSADDLLNRLGVFAVILGMEEVKRRQQHLKEGRAGRAKRREEHRRMAQNKASLISSMSAMTAKR
ncbi:hypothetical protein PRZ48_005060 [Zasmidium cellare]|uniref:Uncharacterized protein n=1 Tax=Zasmidium cellare TaxID=395010 RepID=A0ABR0ERD3_ZASCE|nr:hypothetical protein PRZ48_005060 [Zasmidium cellare]